MIIKTLEVRIKVESSEIATSNLHVDDIELSSYGEILQEKLAADLEESGIRVIDITYEIKTGE